MLKNIYLLFEKAFFIAVGYYVTQFFILPALI